MRMTTRFFAFFAGLVFFSTTFAFFRQQTGGFKNFNQRFAIFELPGSLRAKDLHFNPTTRTNFDPVIGKWR